MLVDCTANIALIFQPAKQIRQIFLLNHEKEFFMGSPHEQDSIKNIIRYLEKANGSDKTYLYYYPSEK